MTTATPETTDTRIEKRLAELTKLRAARKDDLDLPRTMTQREVNTYHAETALLDHRIAAIRTAVETLAAIDLDADQQWLAHLEQWRKVLADELLALPPRIRDREQIARQNNLAFSIKLIDVGLGTAPLPVVTLEPLPLGPLMQAAGYEVQGEALRGPRGWRGGMKEVERRIAAITKQRTAAQAALDAALLDDTARATAEDESRELAAAFNAMHVRMGHDGRLVAYDEDDAVLDPSKMTEVQRKAIERMDAPREAARRAPVETTS
jgi:hypothetical protein